MSPADVKPSARLVRAVAAERAEIERRRARLHRTREQRLAELAEIDGALAQLEERDLLLERLAPAGAPPADDATASNGTPRSVLRGPVVRETAVALLATRDGDAAMHYRDWFQLLAGEGFEVAGKDPLAVFLTQINRSPVVRKTTQAGVYALDRDAPARLRAALAGLEDELRELAGTGATADPAEARARRERLIASIRRTERALDEAERVLRA